VPPTRWNCEEFYDPDPAAALDGRIYCKWGGFLDDRERNAVIDGNQRISTTI